MSRPLVALLASIALVVLGLVAVGVATIVGGGRVRRSRAFYRERLREIAPYTVVLAVILVVNSLTRGLVPEVAWIIGWNITGPIYAVEGTLVARLQGLATPPLTAYFAFAYVYGYVFLLVFPLVAYGVLEAARPLRELVVAYALNYALGLVCYALFVSYGPRNLMPDLVDSLLYTAYPQVQLLTARVNTNTNVFPSLHASLSITVALLAYRTRHVYPRWTYAAAILAASVALSTMYLGIHWVIDVVGGAALAVLSVAVATRRSRVGLLPALGDS